MRSTQAWRDEQSVRDALAAMDDALERCDLEAVLGLCTEDVVFVDEAGEAFDRSAIPSMLASLAEDRELSVKSPIIWESVEVDILGHVAVLIAKGHSRFELGNGSEEVPGEVGAPGSDALDDLPDDLLAELEAELESAEFGWRLTGVLVRVGNRWMWRVRHAADVA